jgi:hypothetical protein
MGILRGIAIGLIVLGIGLAERPMPPVPASPQVAVNHPPEKHSRLVRWVKHAAGFEPRMAERFSSLGIHTPEFVPTPPALDARTAPPAPSVAGK